MPLDVPGCTRATMIIAVSFYNTPVVRVFVVFFACLCTRFISCFSALQLKFRLLLFGCRVCNGMLHLSSIDTALLY